MSMSYSELKTIVVGQTLFNCESGNNIEFSVMEAPSEKFNVGLDSNQLIWVGVDPDGEEMRFLITETLPHYGPKIYTHKAYTEPEDFKNGVPKSNE